MGASSGWNLETRRPPRPRATATPSARVIVRHTRVAGRTARLRAVEHPRHAHDALRMQSAG
jgi:hypothetical protein